MKVKIEIGLSGAAITQDRDGEVARILRQVAARIAEESLESVDTVRLFDLNGNGVGDIWLSDEDEDDLVRVVVAGTEYRVMDATAALVEGILCDEGKN